MRSYDLGPASLDSRPYSIVINNYEDNSYRRIQFLFENYIIKFMIQTEICDRPKRLALSMFEEPTGMADGYR